jgi:hypothetical protein
VLSELGTSPMLKATQHSGTGTKPCPACYESVQAIMEANRRWNSAMAAISCLGAMPPTKASAI